MMTLLASNGQRRVATFVEAEIEVYRACFWCTWCDHQVDTKGRLQSGEVCCEDPTPVMYDEAVVIKVMASVAFHLDDREVVRIVGTVDDDEFILTPDEQCQAVQAASEVW